MTASPTVVHTGTWTKFTGHAYYYANGGWKPVYRGTMVLRYRLAGTTDWHTLSATTATADINGWYKIVIQWPLTRGAVVLAKLLPTTQVKAVWSPAVWITRVANSVQLGKVAGQFRSPAGAIGYTLTAVKLVCSKSVADPYLRWRVA